MSHLRIRIRYQTNECQNQNEGAGSCANGGIYYYKTLHSDNNLYQIFFTQGQAIHTRNRIGANTINSSD